jgi:hypothetical protein
MLSGAVERFAHRIGGYDYIGHLDILYMQDSSLRVAAKRRGFRR